MRKCQRNSALTRYIHIGDFIMKKLSVLLVSFALSANSFAGGNHHHGGGNNEWVAPLVIGGVIGAVVANNMRQDNRTVNVIRVDPMIDCRRGIDYPHPSCYYEQRGYPVVSYPVVTSYPVYPDSFPPGTPPRGYHFEQIYIENCNCFKWTVARD